VSPGKSALHALAAECELNLGELEQARESLERASQADPTFVNEKLRTRIASAESRARAIAAHDAAGPEHAPTLTAALIVRDEEAMLPDCLASLAQFVDEVVVVDTGSTDGTREIAAASGTRVLDAPWEEDFSRARNVSLDAATGDWVLVIDADERLAAGAADGIREFIARTDVDAAEVTVRSATPEEDPLTRLSTLSVRLFRRLPGVRFTGLVHEQVRPSLERLGLSIVEAPIVIEHLGYALTPAAMRAKQERNLRLLQTEIENRQGIVDGLLAMHLGVALQTLGQDREAIPALTFAVSPAGRLDRVLVAHAHTRLAQAQLKIRDGEAAARHVREALALAPDDLFARYLEAGCLYAAGDPQAAASALGELAARAGAQVRSGPLLLDLGDMRAAAGDLAGAERAYAEAGRHLPGDGRPAARLRALDSDALGSRAPVSG
jgi:tetratricopeptide (TPR) repeat protein